MFYGRGVNNKINHLHERSLRIVYKDNNNSFKELLQNDNSFTVHHKNIGHLELFKVKKNLSYTIMNDILQTMTLTYNFWPEFTSLFCLNNVEHSTAGY